ADQPVIICAHRENLPLLLDAACAELGADCPPVDPLRKGEFLVLHRAHKKLAALERYDLSERRCCGDLALVPRGPVAHDRRGEDGQAGGDGTGADTERGRVTPPAGREAANY